MTKYSLRARMMILILAPTLLIGVLLSTFFVVHRYNELQEQLVDAGSSIIEPLAITSEYSMSFRNRDSLKQLISLLHRRHSDIIRSIAIFDEKNTLFVTSNYHHNYMQLQIPQGLSLPPELMLARYGDSLILRTPIMAENNMPETLSTLEPGRQILGYIAIELDLRPVKLQQYKEIFVATLLLLICLCIALLFAYRLMRDVTIPIRNMVNTVDRIRRGQLDSRVEGYMLGELDMLKNGINSMAMSLAAYHEEMQQNIDQATSDLRQTLEQMEIQNVELELAKKRAQEAARIKSEFLANMSHELRTPLNGVIGFTRQMLKTPLNSTQTDYLQTIERSANSLLAIINDVLDFSKLEAGKLILEHIPFSLRETIDEVTILLAHSAHEKGLELTLDVRNGVPEHVIGDPLRLQQVIINLLGNAIKFTEKGNIDIRVELRGQTEKDIEIEVQVHDTGIGINERQQSRLFQAFRQADASISRRHGGTGLGLVITQRLVKEMGGDISFYSQPARGSTFWFHIRLPLNLDTLPDFPNMSMLSGQKLIYIENNPTAAQATLEMLENTPLSVTYAPTIQQVPEYQHYNIALVGVPIIFQHNLTLYRERLDKIQQIANRIILALPTQTLIDAELLKRLGVHVCLSKPLSRGRLFAALLEQPLPALTLPVQNENRIRLPLTVMAVDDNPANLKLIGALLDEVVEKTILCQSGEEAVTVASKNALDMVLMDIQMPEIDGIRAAELIRELPNHKQTPIIAVTAHAAIGERERLLNAGMDDYLTKPIDEHMLLKLLSRYQYAGIVNTEHSSVSEARAKPDNEKNQLLKDDNASLDWNLALQQSANKPELALELLQMLLDFLPEVESRVQRLLSDGNDEKIIDLIHKLHGSCSYCGVPKLKKMCYFLEKELRKGIPVSELEPEWLELLDELANVIKAGKEKLQQLRSPINSH